VHDRQLETELAAVPAKLTVLPFMAA